MIELIPKQNKERREDSLRGIIDFRIEEAKNGFVCRMAYMVSDSPHSAMRGDLPAEFIATTKTDLKDLFLEAFDQYFLNVVAPAIDEHLNDVNHK